MVTVNLNKPGRQAVLDSGERYRVYQCRFGSLEIERVRDGATLFLQDDDAIQLKNDIDKGGVCDIVCDAYDGILCPAEPISQSAVSRSRVTP